jgi:hypothetical protein
MPPYQRLYQVSPFLRQANNTGPQTASLEPLHFTEEELMNLYEDLLALPPSEQSKPTETQSVVPAQVDEDIAIVSSVDQRLSTVEDQTTHSASGYNAHTSVETNIESAEHEALAPSVQPYRRVISRAHGIISRIESVRSSVNLTSGSESTDVPISVLSLAECESLVRVCVS